MTAKKRRSAKIERWHGIFKLQEELNELNHVLSKIVGRDSDGRLDSAGLEELVRMFNEECGDVRAALRYFMLRNTEFSDRAIRRRAAEKFERWSARGLPGLLVSRPDGK